MNKTGVRGEGLGVRGGGGAQRRGFLSLGFALMVAGLGLLILTLNGRYNSIHTWEADFTQIYTAGLTTRTERGHLFLEKPGKMRWDYSEPIKKVFLVNGDEVWQYTAGDRKATESKVDNLNDLRSPLRFLLGHLDLNKELDQISFSGLAPWQKGDKVIEGIPKGPVEAAGWRKLWIEVSPTYEITRLVILSLDGSQNDIRFSDIRVNRGLPKDIFKIGVRGEG